MAIQTCKFRSPNERREVTHLTGGRCMLGAESLESASTAFTEGLEESLGGQRPWEQVGRVFSPGPGVGRAQGH